MKLIFTIFYFCDLIQIDRSLKLNTHYKEGIYSINMLFYCIRCVFSAKLTYEQMLYLIVVFQFISKRLLWFVAVIALCFSGTSLYLMSYTARSASTPSWHPIQSTFQSKQWLRWSLYSIPYHTPRSVVKGKCLRSMEFFDIKIAI